MQEITIDFSCLGSMPRYWAMTDQLKECPSVMSFWRWLPQYGEDLPIDFFHQLEKPNHHPTPVLSSHLGRLEELTKEGHWVELSPDDPRIPEWVKTSPARKFP